MEENQPSLHSMFSWTPDLACVNMGELLRET